MHPEGVILTITIMKIMKIVKVLTQVINAALVHFAFNKNMGSFALLHVPLLLLECALKHAQIIVLMASLDTHFTALLLAIVLQIFDSCPARAVRDTTRNGTWLGWSLIRQPDPKDCE